MQAVVSILFHFKQSPVKRLGITALGSGGSHTRCPDCSPLYIPAGLEPVCMIHGDSPILLGLFNYSVNFIGLLRIRNFPLLRNFSTFLLDLSTFIFKLGDVIPPMCLGLIQVSCLVSDERPDMLTHQ